MGCGISNFGFDVGSWVWGLGTGDWGLGTWVLVSELRVGDGESGIGGDLGFGPAA